MSDDSALGLWVVAICTVIILMAIVTELIRSRDVIKTIKAQVAQNHQERVRLLLADGASRDGQNALTNRLAFLESRLETVSENTGSAYVLLLERCQAMEKIIEQVSVFGVTANLTLRREGSEALDELRRSLLVQMDKDITLMRKDISELRHAMVQAEEDLRDLDNWRHS